MEKGEGKRKCLAFSPPPLSLGPTVESPPKHGSPSKLSNAHYRDRSFNVRRHKKDEPNLHRLLLAVAFNYIN